MKAALQNTQFRLFFLGVFFSVQAVWIQRVAIGWLAWEQSGSASFVGVISALSLAPSLVGGPLFGVMADRVDIRRAAQATNGAMMLAITGLAVALPWIGPAGLALGAGVIGLISAAHHPVRMSLGPRLVPTELVAHVVTATALNFNLARLLAPALTGALIAAVGVGPALWTAVLFYVPMALVLPRLRPRALPPRAKAAFLSDLAGGFRYVLRTPQVRFAFLLTLVFATTVRGALEVLPVLADGAFGRGAAGLGLLTGAAGGGAILTAALRAVRAGRIGHTVPRSVKLTAAAGLLAVIAMGQVPVWEAALLATAVAGGAATWCGVSLQAVVQTGLPDDLRGRVMSLWTVAGFGMTAVGALVIGALADAIGLGPALALAGLCGLVAHAGLLISDARRSRNAYI